ncbi:small multidrug export protein [Candidatus Termititenax aidoneus]|uniref:Small multidrug export protein n=1 Tax=Termititenax aidoneus TaxID=2218524 RepID=A0A388T7F5_TERA1|nr:small multidrug export protein [Candidatus Termititenax aidoneus]
MLVLNWLLVLALSATPLLELRASIPYGFAVKLPPLAVLLLSVAGSWLPAFFVVFILEYVEPFLRKIKFLNDLLDRVYAKTRAKSEQIQKWEFWGLILFIGVPLPGTGVWTGSLAGYLLGLSRRKIILASLLGTTLAGLAMVLILTLGISGFNWLFKV